MPIAYLFAHAFVPKDRSEMCLREILLNMEAGGLINWAKFRLSYHRSPNKGGAQTEDPPYSVGLKFVDPPSPATSFPADSLMVLKYLP